MIDLPNPPGNLGGLVRWAYQLTDRLRDYLDQSKSPNTLLFVGSRGVGRTPMMEPGGGGPAATLPMVNQWEATLDYVTGDFAFCDKVAERDDGTQAGLYQCTSDIAGNVSNTHPSVDGAHWKQIARGHWGKITFRSGSNWCQVDCTTPKPKLKIYTNTSTDGTVTIDLGDVQTGAGIDTEIKIRETEGRDESTGLCKKCQILRSDWYS